MDATLAVRNGGAEGLTVGTIDDDGGNAGRYKKGSLLHDSHVAILRIHFFSN